MNYLCQKCKNDVGHLEQCVRETQWGVQDVNILNMNQLMGAKILVFFSLSFTCMLILTGRSAATVTTEK